MLNTRWPGDVPPLKRLFGMKLKTVYLKKQVYNYAHWIPGSGWWGRGDVDEGMLGVIQAWGPPDRGAEADHSTFILLSATGWVMDTAHEMLEILGSGYREGGSAELISAGSHSQQKEHRNWGYRRARFQPCSALPLILNSSLRHSFLHQVCTKHRQYAQDPGGTDKKM